MVENLLDNTQEIISVSEINRRAKSILEENFPLVWIQGEVSNFFSAASGHWYFSLKDESSEIRCAMFANKSHRITFEPKDGDHLVLNGTLSIFEGRGQYQIIVEHIELAGEGALLKAFEELKKKLLTEGLFDDSLKKKLPSYPRSIAVVTSPDGAVIQDIINVLSRRSPFFNLTVVPTLVQGEKAAPLICEALNKASNLENIDLIILARGGGSIEDLWAFNEEIVARAIYNCNTPVISGVGHEIDFTIADFVADLRAPTPTAAMELATPDQTEIFGFIDDFSYTSTNNIFSIINNHKESVENIISSYGFRAYDSIIKNKTQNLDNLIYRIQNNTEQMLNKYKNILDQNRNLLESHNVEKILKKGFVLVKQDENFVLRASDFDKGKETKLKFYDNEIKIK